MTDIEWATEGVELEQARPRRLGDLHAGEPLLLSARLGEGSRDGMLRLGGQTRDGWVRVGVPLRENAPREAGIALRWARKRVTALMDSLHEGADPSTVRDEVVDLGLGFHLVTAYTSLVAVDDLADAVGPARPVRIASALPRGGTDGPMRLLLGWLLLVAGLTLLAILLPGHGK
jgi:Ca-activated chloride channel family protein